MTKGHRLTMSDLSNRENSAPKTSNTVSFWSLMDPYVQKEGGVFGKFRLFIKVSYGHVFMRGLRSKLFV